MKNKIILAVIALLVGLSIGYAAFHSSEQKLGSAITAYNCLNNAALCNSLNSIVADLQTQRAASNATAVATTSFTIPALGIFGVTTSTTSTLVTVTGAAVGDAVKAVIATSTGWSYLNADVTAANTVRVVVTNASTTATGALGAATLTVYDWAAATYGQSSALITTTSTTF